jgi:hypothetical protein
MLQRGARIHCHPALVLHMVSFQGSPGKIPSAVIEGVRCQRLGHPPTLAQPRRSGRRRCWARRSPRT